MHISGILVAARPEATERCARRLEALPGLEVTAHDPASGRIVVVQETDTLSAQEEGLRRIQALPEVRFAALVEHRFEDRAEGEEEASTRD